MNNNKTNIMRLINCKYIVPVVISPLKRIIVFEAKKPDTIKPNGGNCFELLRIVSLSLAKYPNINKKTNTPKIPKFI